MNTPELTNQKNILLQLGFPIDGWGALEKYVESLWKANDELNLFSRQMTLNELIENHVVDCALALPHLPQGHKLWADLGSGGGLPGVLFALARPNTEVHLYEKSPKKRDFLESCQKIAPNLRIYAEVPKDLPRVQLITARAFKPLDVILDMTREYYLRGGSYALLKGRSEKIEEEIRDTRKKFKDFKCQIVKLHSPLLDVERHLVVIN